LKELSEKKLKEFYLGSIGKKAKVLFENGKPGKMLMGWTENYIRVETKFSPGLVNSLHEVEITGINENGNMSINYR
jgi:threonylcarbamoyladenosine tRNA methylthiotransferase MtaB